MQNPCRCCGLRNCDLLPNYRSPTVGRFTREISMRALAVIVLATAFGMPAMAQAPKTASETKAAKPAKPPTDANMVIRESANSVQDTLDKLTKAAEAKGAKVVARIDHAAGAKAVGVAMKPTEVLFFGNPKIGTPVMLGNIRAGLDLPLKVLAWEDAAGKVWVGYTKPSVLQSRYRLAGKEQAANVKAIAEALDGLTGAAIAK